MKKRAVLLLALISMGMTACGNQNVSATDASIVQSIVGIPIVNPEDVTKEESSTLQRTDSQKESEQKSTVKNAEITFLDLSKYYYGFTGGANSTGLSEFLYIEKDGTFHGTYSFFDSGDAGDGYSLGTSYISDYTGSFTDLVKVDDFCYEMKIDNVSYRKSPGAEQRVDEVREVCSEWHCLNGTSTCRIYLPGFDINELSEEVTMWLSFSEDVQGGLIAPILVNLEKESALEGYERRPPYIDTKGKLNAVNASYEYYGELLNEAMDMGYMEPYACKRYEVTDACLNYIWNLVKYNVSEEEYPQILEEQRNWIKEKEQKANTAADEFGGTMAVTEYNEVCAAETLARCAVLAGYLE